MTWLSPIDKERRGVSSGLVARCPHRKEELTQVLVPPLMALSVDGNFGDEVPVGPLCWVTLGVVPRSEALDNPQLLAERLKGFAAKLCTVISMDHFRCSISAHNFLEEQLRDDGTRCCSDREGLDVAGGTVDKHQEVAVTASSLRKRSQEVCGDLLPWLGLLPRLQQTFCLCLFTLEPLTGVARASIFAYGTRHTWPCEGRLETAKSLLATSMTRQGVVVENGNHSFHEGGRNNDAEAAGAIIVSSGWLVLVEDILLERISIQVLAIS